jgi:serine/threonine-protein kinase
MSGEGVLNSQATPQPPARRIGPYEIVRELGRGSMGVVFLVRVPGMKRELAVKVMSTARLSNETARERFRREAKLLARVRHPNVIQVHDAGEDGGRLWYSMDVVKGESLEERVQRSGPLDPLTACAFLRDVALAVQAIHDQGILHRDLKPANILIDEAGKPLLADFGLALDLDQDDATRLTKTGASVGTPMYMSPEQVHAKRDVDARADVYGLGAILYYALAGQEPFVCETIEDLVKHILVVVPQAPSRFGKGVSPAIDEVCLRALAKDRTLRYASATHLAWDLDRLVRGEVPLPPRRRRGSGARVLLYVPAVAIAAALLAAGPWLDAARARESALAAEARATAAKVAVDLAAENRRAADSALLVARNHLTEGSLETARASVASGLHSVPGDPLLLAASVRALMAPGTADLADHEARAVRGRAALAKALEAAPDHPQVLLAQALVAFWDHDKDVGRLSLEKALAPARGADSRTWLDAAEMSIFYVGPSDVSFQRAACERVIATLPDWAHAHMALAHVLKEARDLPGEEHELDRVIELDADNMQAHYDRSRVRQLRNDFTRARDDMLLVYGHDPENGDIIFELGTIEDSLGHSEEALKLYDLSIARLRPDRTWPAHRRRGNLKRKLKDYTGAIEDLEPVVSAHDNSDDEIALGDCYLSLSRYKDARGMFEKAVAKDPTDGHAVLLLGLTCELDGRPPAEARAYYEHALTQVTEPAYRSKIVARMGQIDAARSKQELERRQAILVPRTAESRKRLDAIEADLDAAGKLPEGPVKSARMAAIKHRLDELTAYQEETRKLLGDPP